MVQGVDPRRILERLSNYVAGGLAAFEFNDYARTRRIDSQKIQVLAQHRTGLPSNDCDVLAFEQHVWVALDPILQRPLQVGEGRFLERDKVPGLGHAEDGHVADVPRAGGSSFVLAGNAARNCNNATCAAEGS